MNCRHCNNILTETFIDLGFAPPSNAYLSKDNLKDPEKYFPLKVKVCLNCWLVQTEDYTNAKDLFDDKYAYFSSTSTSWLEHAYIYSNKIIDKLYLNQNSFVIEIASNDGYLLKNFVSKNIPCLGIEPTNNTAKAAETLGIPVLKEFFSEKLGLMLSKSSRSADLIIGNNVYAHVPDINDFTKGLKATLKPNGTITLEFPHLMNLIANDQFDTIYHEHFSYLSLFTVKNIFGQCGLKIYDVEEINTHGGSLRIYAAHSDDLKLVSNNVHSLLEKEKKFGLQNLSTYKNFQRRAEEIKNKLLFFLIEKKFSGKKVVAYGAAAKGNTFLNFAGIKSDLIPFIFDEAASKQNKFLPGSHIEIISPNQISQIDFDFLWILPWNIAKEIKGKYKDIVKKHVEFFVAIPDLRQV